MAILDKRMVKTKKAIRSAFAELSTEKEIEQITVTDIAKRADINRKTFYAHYGSIDDILSEVENELVAYFEKDMEKLDLKNMEYPMILFDYVSRRIKGDFEFYSRLFRGRASFTLFTKLIDLYVEKSKLIFADTEMTEEQIEIMSGFTLAGANYVYQRWYTRYPERSLDELMEDLGILMMQGVSGYKKSKITKK